MKTNFIFGLVLLALGLASGLALAQEDKAKAQHTLKARIVQRPAREKTLGYFTVKEHTVVIDSAGGTIHLELPRIGPGHPIEDVKVTRERLWPINSPEYTGDFVEWCFRVQKANDAGELPPLQK